MVNLQEARNHIQEKHGYNPYDYSGRYCEGYQERDRKILRELCEKHGHPYEFTQTGYSPNHPDRAKLEKTYALVRADFDAQQPLYQSFWHWILFTYGDETYGFDGEPCSYRFTMTMKEYDKCTEDWQKRIFMDYINEFGGNKKRVRFYT